MVDDNDSIIVLSTDEATRPIEPSSPAVLSRRQKTQNVFGSCHGRQHGRAPA
jgi:hypothetical protein